MIKQRLMLLGIALLISISMAVGAEPGQKGAAPPSALPQADSSVTREIAASLQPFNQSTTSAPGLQRRNPRYEIQLNDALTINFTFTPEYNETVTVQPDGFVSLIGLPDLHVAGMTVPELNETLRTKYSKILHNPALTVNVTSFVQPTFVATGMVAKPGRYQLHGETTLSEGIALAGGFTDREAKHSDVLLFRKVSDQWVEAQRFNLKKMFKSGKLAEDPQLQPGDMIFVPKNLLSKIIGFSPILVPLDVFRIQANTANF